MNSDNSEILLKMNINLGTFKDIIIICRLKPRTTAETIAFHNNQLGSIVSGSISLANYFKGTLVFKSFIPVRFVLNFL